MQIMRTQQWMVLIPTAFLCLSVHAQSKFDIAIIGPGKAPVSRESAAYSINYAGDDPPRNITGRFDKQHSTFNRPIDCTSLSTRGSATAYDTVAVTNRGSRTATLNLRMGAAGSPHATCPASADTVMAVYDSFFAAASPLTNCIAVNDDASATDHCSTLRGIAVPPGKTRVIVLTQYAVGSSPDYELTFDGSVPVTLQQFSID